MDQLLMSQENVAKRWLIHRSVSSYVMFQILIGYVCGGKADY